MANHDDKVRKQDSSRCIIKYGKLNSEQWVMILLRDTSWVCICSNTVRKFGENIPELMAVCQPVCSLQCISCTAHYFRLKWVGTIAAHNMQHELVTFVLTFVQDNDWQGRPNLCSTTRYAFNMCNVDLLAVLPIGRKRWEFFVYGATNKCQKKKYAKCCSATRSTVKACESIKETTSKMR